MSFGGPYRNPDDLGAIYGDVHFTWALDYFEESQNSAWLLPNRIYEGCLWGAVPLALANVETGRWLSQRKTGLLLPDPPYDALHAFFGALSTGQYDSLSDAVLSLPRADLVDDSGSCRALVGSLPSQRFVWPSRQTAAATNFVEPLNDWRR